MKAATSMRATLLAFGLLFAAGCSAQGDAAASPSPAASKAATPASASTAGFVAGKEYVSMRRPTGQAAPTGPVVVMEVFSYGCSHCAHFAAYMDALRDQLPRGVEVRYLPAAFGPDWVPFAQAFYAARDLGVLKQTHAVVFKAMLEHYPLNSLGDLATFYARQGVDRAKFMAAATSDATTQQLKDDTQTIVNWGIDGTPSIVVGRLANASKDAAFVPLLRSYQINSYEQLQQVGLWMAHQVSQQKP